MAQSESNIEITVTNRSGGPPFLHEWFEINHELALEFLQKMSATVAELPGKHAVCKKVGEDGEMVVEIELNKRSPPSVKRPTFEELSGRKE